MLTIDLSTVSESRYYTTNEVCALLGIHRNTLANYVKRRLISPSAHRTNHIYYSGKQVKKLMQQFY